MNIIGGTVGVADFFLPASVILTNKRSKLYVIEEIRLRGCYDTTMTCLSRVKRPLGNS